MKSSDYKETFRHDMIKWSEEEKIRQDDQCYFLRKALETADKPIWLICDARRMCDLHFFDNSPEFQDVQIIRIRIQASEETRKQRAWIFTPGVDDVASECGLDDYEKWDHIIVNDGQDPDALTKQLDNILPKA